MREAYELSGRVRWLQTENQRLREEIRQLQALASANDMIGNHEAPAEASARTLRIRLNS